MTYLPSIEIETHPGESNASIIWLHGLGASGDDFANLTPELRKLLALEKTHIRFIFPHAAAIPVSVNNGYTMPAWYDILDMPTQPLSGEPVERTINQQQLLQSSQDIHKLIDREIERGVKSERIFILGFSQGGAVAYHAALTYPQPLAGLAGLSTYFPTLKSPNVFSPCYCNKTIDIRIYHGNQDEVVSESLGIKAKQDLTALGYQTHYQNYPMAHQVCYEQVVDIAQWINQRLS